MSRMVEHLIGHEISFTLTGDGEGEDSELFAVLLGITGDTIEHEYWAVRHQESTGASEYPYTRIVEEQIPGWQIRSIDGWSGIMYCSAWECGRNVDPRTTDDGVPHSDGQGMSLCPVHEL